MNGSGWTCAVGLVFGPLACSGSSPVVPVVPPEVASQKVTFETVQDLGGFTLQSSAHDERVTTGGKVLRESAVSLKWKDRDHWEYESLTDGRPTTHWLVNEGSAWESLSGGLLTLKGDPEPLRAQLGLAWDPWEDVVALTGGRIQYGAGVPETVDGRAAVRHDVSLAPAATVVAHRSFGPAMEPVALSGTVWIDSETAVRLLADVTVQSATPGDASRSRTFNVKLAVTGLGQDPGVAVPPAASPLPGAP